MPELPDITIYVEGMRDRLIGQPLMSLRLFRPFVLRSISPTPKEVELRLVESVDRLGKRLVIGLQEDKYIVIHLMISGRLLWRNAQAKPPGKIGVAAFDFPDGTLLFTEASSKKRASIHLVQGRERLIEEHSRGGADVATISIDEFAKILKRENRTLKRALTDPTWFDGIGNAYSDEILHASGLSPMRQTNSLSDQEVSNLHVNCRTVLGEWTARLREEFSNRFPGPGDITAFRPDFAVHGKFGKPCPICGKPVQRIVYADNETNYCAVCQNGGRILADRALSRLLKGDYPREFDD